jgi:DNA polymerase-3 subunit gamma/tau
VISISYKALYRVYRPQSFHEVVGQEAVTRTLKNAIKEKKISHAYLFSGPRGTGKTSAAKLFAKAVNCLNPQEGEPCNQCEACKGVQSGETLDILEIDAASNRGVDEIRDIRDKVMLQPSSLTYKVYIIDEVHMLTNEAFNALLKTLEEPPEHVIFILATTEPHKLPLTIVSRCQRFDFHKFSISAIMSRLRYVSDQVGIAISDETLATIAKFSEGGMRDALGILDQAYSFAGNEISLEDVHFVTGTLSANFLSRLIRELKEKNIANTLALLDEVILSGKDPEQVIKGLIQYLRDLLVFKNAPDLEEMQGRVLLEPDFKSLSEQLKSSEIFKAIEHLNKMQNEMKWSAHPRIMLEVALIQLCEQVFQEGENESGLWRRIEQLEQKIGQLEKQGPVVRQEAGFTPKAQSGDEEKRRLPTSSDLPLFRLKSIYQQANPKFLDRMLELWPSILELVRAKDVRTAAWLKQGKPVLVTEQAVLLAFNSAIHRESTELPENKKIIEEALLERTKVSFEIATVMLDQWNDFLAKHKELLKEEKEELDPIIKEAIQLVGEELVHIKNRRER